MNQSPVTYRTVFCKWIYIRTRVVYGIYETRLELANTIGRAHTFAPAQGEGSYSKEYQTFRLHKVSDLALRLV